jgi:hypothetical protein
VEVHLLGNFKPAPKPDIEPIPPKTLPGASLKWAIGSAGSISLPPPHVPFANVGLSLFVFHKLDQDRGTGLYISAPIGVSLSVSALLKMFKDQTFSDDPMAKLLLQAIEKALITGTLKGMFSGLSGHLKEVRVQNAFRHKDLGDAGIAQSQALGGLGKMISVSGKLPEFGDNGKIVRFHNKTFFEELSKDIPLVTPYPTDNAFKLDITLGKFTGGGLLRIAWLT